MSIDEKINRIRHKKTCGKFIYGLAVIVLLMLILIKVDTVCTMAADGLDQQMEHRQITETEKPVAQVTESALADDDREYIARVLMEEAGGSIDGMVAVATTIKDRGDLWNMKYIDVVMQPGQYASPDWDKPIAEEALAAVRMVFDQGIRAFKDPVTHFHSSDISAPYWTENKVNRGERGGNVFWY